MLSVFTLAAAVFAAVLVYSLVTSGSIAPRYRLTSYLTGVVMVSATIELGLLTPCGGTTRSRGTGPSTSKQETCSPTASGT